MIKKIKLNKKEIIDLQLNNDPYLFIDEATEIVPGKSSKGFKYLKNDEWYFKIHWPQDPNMPAALQIESLTQTCSLALLTLNNDFKKAVYISRIADAKFIKKVTPDQKITLETKVIKFNRGIANCYGKGFLENNEIFVESNFILVLPHILNEYKIKL